MSLWLSGLVTTTSTAPAAAWTGVVTSMRVESTKVTVVAASPSKVTLVTPLSKFVPVMVTEVPPAVGPLVGVVGGVVSTEVTEGPGGKYV